MFRRAFWRFACVTLKDGTTLDGTLSPTNPQRLLTGVAKLPDGRCYKGTYDAQDGHPLPGSQLEEDGDLYVGSFNARWQRHGQGEAWLADGTHYHGTFADDELTEGTVRIPTGPSEVVFRGNLRDESFVHGTLTQAEFTYTGEFRNNKPHGRGVLTFESGASQEGTFCDGKLHGSECRMKLEGGSLYVGEFVAGVIKRGVLYTPTYQYDGEFSEQGRAHGEGTQTQLTSSPKLIFTGIWHHGSLIRGTCVDEHGTPVDWLERHDLQHATVRDQGRDPDEVLAMHRYCEAKLRDADTMFREHRSAYHRDAGVVMNKNSPLEQQQQEKEKTEQEEASAAVLSPSMTARPRMPSMHELGYEHGLRDGNAALQARMVADSNAAEATKAAVAARQRREIHFESTTSDSSRDGKHDEALPLPMAERVNLNLAQVQIREQAGAQQVAADHMRDQLQRFLRDHAGDNQRGEAQPQESSTSAGQSPKRGLYIDGNATWKTFTPK